MNKLRQNKEAFLTMANNLDLLRQKTIVLNKQVKISDMDREFLEVMVNIAVDDLAAGESPERISMQINMKDCSSGDTMLLKACRFNLPHLVRDLVRCPQLDVNYRNPHTGYNAVSICILSNNIECFNGVDEM